MAVNKSYQIDSAQSNLYRETNVIFQHDDVRQPHKNNALRHYPPFTLNFCTYSKRYRNFDHLANISSSDPFPDMLLPSRCLGTVRRVLFVKQLKHRGPGIIMFYTGCKMRT